MVLGKVESGKISRGMPLTMMPNKVCQPTLVLMLVSFDYITTVVTSTSF